MLDEIYQSAKEQYTTIGNKCVVGQWAAGLNEKDKDAFDASINDVDFSTRSLFRLYQKAGATFGLTSLLVHRNGECGCP